MELGLTRRSRRETAEWCVATTMRGCEPKWLRCQPSPDSAVWHNLIALPAAATSSSANVRLISIGGTSDISYKLTLTAGSNQFRLHCYITHQLSTQRTCKPSDIQNTSLTSDKQMNILTYGTICYVITYSSYKNFQPVPFLSEPARY